MLYQIWNSPDSSRNYRQPGGHGLLNDHRRGLLIRQKTKCRGLPELTKHCLLIEKALELELFRQM